MSRQTQGVPVLLLQKFHGKKINVSTNNNEMLVGTLLEAEDNMNLSLSNVTVIMCSGKTVDMINVYVKGSRIRYINLPDEAKDTVSLLTRQANRPPTRRGGRSSFSRRRY
ncbi:Small nuclear ribonucleoprotein Sm D3, partial [Stegodyphus mimosarum]